ncbi:MAG: PD-(D/E)XK motif protein [Bacteroides sp.]|nr:PD-(D/E)XK motif protein [Bacteroides sp.]
MKTLNNINLLEKFLELKARPQTKDGFNAMSISETSPHRIGITSEGYPIFFIACSSSERVSDISLRLFKVLFNRQCTIFDTVTGSDIQDTFSIIQLSSLNSEFQKYFLEVVYLLLCRLEDKPTVNVLKAEISKLLSLFTSVKSISSEVIRGLWAELILIKQSSTPSYLIRSWHVLLEDKFDFNDGIDKVEVKSTNGSKREHTFALGQLNPNKGSRLLIASMFVSQTGVGKTIFDIVDDISSNISDVDVLFKLRKETTQTIGSHIEEVSSIFFDEAASLESLQFFDYASIPSINTENVPPEVTGVHFRSDLSDISPVDSFDQDSVLFMSL